MTDKEKVAALMQAILSGNAARAAQLRRELGLPKEKKK